MKQSIATVCLLAGTALQTGPLWAQTSTVEQMPTTAPAPDETPDIVVTGSRIQRSGETTSTPTVMLGAQEIEKAGSVSSGDLLRQLPAIAPGLGAESGATGFNSAGLDLVDLRALGTNRTLVLVNGRRQVGSNPNTTSVDLNTIPTPLIERMEVITGGASAVYGADAVSGVLNVILKKDFDGLQIDAQVGTASRGDAERYSLSALAGTNFADGRGNVTGFVGYTKEGGIAYDARSRAISGLNYIPNPQNTGPKDGIPDYVIARNVRQIGGQRESAFLLDRGRGLEAFGFNADGSVRSFGLGPSGLIGGSQLTDGGEAELGFDAQCPQAKCQLRVPVERFLLSTMANYEFGPAATLFIEGRFAKTKSQSRIGSVFEIPPVTNKIAIDNPYVSPSLRALMQEAGVASIGVLRSDQELGLRGQDATRNLFQLTAGVHGEIGVGNLRYETSFQYGELSFENTRVNDLDQQRFLNGIDAVRDADGIVRCRSIEARAQGCVPINLLQPGAALSPAVLGYVKIPYATETANLSQLVASGNITGDIGDFWGAGPISFAIGAEYRREASSYIVSPVDAAGQGFFFTKRQSTTGRFDVKEAFGEFVLPLLSNIPFVKRLEIEGAVRFSDYSTSGKTTSWKIGATYAPSSDIRFRGVLARAVRAPNVGELFSPASEGFITVDDPCDRNFVGGGAGRAASCKALGVPSDFISNARSINIRTSTSGNPNLGVEKADTITLGAVLTPSFLPGFSATVDYFNIKIKSAINVFSPQDILNNCVDLPTVDNPFCASIVRAANGDISQIRRQNINVSRLDREGVDLELRYREDLGSLGILSLNAVGTRMMKVTTVVAPGTVTGSNVTDFNGEFGYPKWKGRLTANWAAGSFDVTGTLNYLSNMVREKQPLTPEDNRALYGSGDYFLLNLQAGYTISEGKRLYIGVDNVFDRQPPFLPDTRAGGAGSFPGAEIFPVTGAYFYTGLSFRF